MGRSILRTSLAQTTAATFESPNIASGASFTNAAMASDLPTVLRFGVAALIGCDVPEEVSSEARTDGVRPSSYVRLKATRIENEVCGNGERFVDSAGVNHSSGGGGITGHADGDSFTSVAQFELVIEGLEGRRPLFSLSQPPHC
jgi:hypothetical protein